MTNYKKILLDLLFKITNWDFSTDIYEIKTQELYVDQDFKQFKWFVKILAERFKYIFIRLLTAFVL